MDTQEKAQAQAQDDIQIEICPREYPIMHADVLKSNEHIKKFSYWTFWLWASISVVIFCCLFISFTYLYKYVR